MYWSVEDIYENFMNFLCFTGISTILTKIRMENIMKNTIKVQTIFTQATSLLLLSL